MTDELLFSVLGLRMESTNTSELVPPTLATPACDYETCRASQSENYEVGDNLLASRTTNTVECYTDLTCSPEVPWSDWTTNTSTSSGNYLNPNL